jgi:tRNA A-37 threonylcarbamoyl transferase component Bud32
MRENVQGVSLEQLGEQLQDNLNLRGDMIGARVGNVVIESKIATGGMAVVYLGRQEITGRKVAVKILRPERQLSYRDREYFVREGRALGQIRHPHLVELYAAGVTEDGRHYMILEYVPGRNLREVIEQDGALEPLRCMRLFRQLLLALEAAHATGIVHRDLKPDNVLVEPLERNRERLRLADLGLVKFTTKRLPALTGHGMTVGTPCYMSPEQVRGESLDARSDLYTVGVLMFEALTSYLPYPEEKTVDGLLDHILDTHPAKLTRADRKFKRLPGIQALLDRLMAKAPEDRPADAAEVVQDIDRILETELSKDVAEAQATRPTETLAVIADTPTRVAEGILITFELRRQGQPAPISPQILRLLRETLEVGGICCAQRAEAQATFGMPSSRANIELLARLPGLLRAAQSQFEGCTIGAGVVFGAFEVSPEGAPVAAPLLERAQALAQGAQDGQVLIPRDAAPVFGVKDSPDDHR